MSPSIKRKATGYIKSAALMTTPAIEATATIPTNLTNTAGLGRCAGGARNASASIGVR